MHAKVYDRTVQPVVYRSSAKPQTNGFHEFILLFSILLQIDRVQLTAVYCNRRGVQRQHTKKDPFSQCEQIQEIHMQVKSEYVGTLTTTELMTRMRSTTTCLTWTQTWSMWTRTSTTLETRECFFDCSSVVSLKCRPRLISCTSHLWLKAQDSRSCLIQHVSCSRWVTLSSTSPSTSNFLLFIIFSTPALPSALHVPWVQEGNSHAHCRWGVGSPWLELLLHTFVIMLPDVSAECLHNVGTATCTCQLRTSSVGVIRDSSESSITDIDLNLPSPILCHDGATEIVGTWCWQDGVGAFWLHQSVPCPWPSGTRESISSPGPTKSWPFPRHSPRFSSAQPR